MYTLTATIKWISILSMKIIVVAGARPNFMKVAPLLEALRRVGGEGIGVVLVHTGQHYDRAMSDSFFNDLEIPAPDVHLGVGSGTHAEQTARVMVAFEQTCVQKLPDWVVVVGDVNSTLACAITAKKLNICLAHVEAGLRSGDRTMPEEINRLCTDAITDLFFTTDAIASDNLVREGVASDKIHMVGNTMIDTLLRHIDRARRLPLPEGVEAGKYAVITMHRPANVDNITTLLGLSRVITQMASRIPIVFPVHPRTRAKLEASGCLNLLSAEPNIHLVEPLSYLPFLGLVARSRFVLTDSGGIQEETTVLGIPCLTMRSNTERPITCELGSNTLVGSDPLRILQAAEAVLDGIGRQSRIPENWDGHAAERIVRVLLERRHC